jgi:triacylglycerol esterase/lipase EstA (alpha/beta hydrolase family)
MRGGGSEACEDEVPECPMKTGLNSVQRSRQLERVPLDSLVQHASNACNPPPELCPGQLSHSCIPQPVYYVPVSSATHLTLLSDPESSAQALKLPLAITPATPVAPQCLSIVCSTTATPTTLLVCCLSHPRRRLSVW